MAIRSVIYGTGVAATDMAALNAEVAAAADGDTIQLQNGAGGEGFNLGEVKPWQRSKVYAAGDFVFHWPHDVGNQSNLRVYVCAVGGTSAASGSGPSAASAGIVDGTVTWNYIYTVAGTPTSSWRTWRILGKNLTVQGVKDANNAKPRIYGGTFSIFISGAGKRVMLQDLHLDEWAGRCLFTNTLADVGVVRCDITNSTLWGKAWFNTAAQVPGVTGTFKRHICMFAQNMTGEILFQDNFLDFEMAADSAADPYGQCQSLGHARLLADWFGCGFLSQNQSETTKTKWINNVCKNFTNNGLNANTNRGANEMYGNEVHTPWFSPKRIRAADYTVLAGSWTWNGTTTVLSSDTSGVAVGDWVALDGTTNWKKIFQVASIAANVSVTLHNPFGLTIPSGATAYKMVGIHYDGYPFQTGCVSWIPQYNPISTPTLGTLNCHNNRLYVRGAEQVALRISQIPLRTTKPGPVAFTNNVVVMEVDEVSPGVPKVLGCARSGVFIDTMDNSYIGQNKFSGKADYLFEVGNRPAQNGSYNNAFVGNNATGFEACDVAVRLGPDSAKTTVVGSVYGDDTHASDAGLGNRVTGVGSMAGGVGAGLQAVMDAKMLGDVWMSIEAE